KNGSPRAAGFSENWFVSPRRKRYFFRAFRLSSLKPMPSRRLFPLFLAVIFAWLGSSRTASAEWETRKINGREYVNVAGMQKFYGFDSFQQGRREVVLENKKVIMKLRPGSQECRMNGVKFVFSYKLEES